jgi:hypothetical protein
MTTGGSRKRWRRLLLHKTRQPPSGFDPEKRFVLDEAAFWEKMLGTIPPDVRWDG